MLGLAALGLKVLKKGCSGSRSGLGRARARDERLPAPLGNAARLGVANPTDGGFRLGSSLGQGLGREPPGPRRSGLGADRAARVVAAHQCFPHPQLGRCAILFRLGRSVLVWHKREAGCGARGYRSAYVRAIRWPRAGGPGRPRSLLSCAGRDGTWSRLRSRLCRPGWPALRARAGRRDHPMHSALRRRASL